MLWDPDPGPSLHLPGLPLTIMLLGQLPFNSEISLVDEDDYKLKWRSFKYIVFYIQGMKSMKYKHCKYLQCVSLITMSFLIYCIMFSTGIFSSLLNYMYILPYKSTFWSGHEHLIRMSMKVLQAIARNNGKVLIYFSHIPMYR